MELLYTLSFILFLHQRIVKGDASVSLRGPDSPDSPPVLTCGGVDLVFLVDTSRSIWELDYQRQLNFIEKVVSKFDIGPGPKQTRVGIILYAHTYWVWFYLRQHMDLKSLKAAIRRIPHKAGSRTRTEKGLKFLRTHMFRPWFGGRPDTMHVAILISDGVSQDKKKTREEAQRVRDAGIKIFTIGVGKRADMDELREIASDPDEHFVFQVGNFKALDSINYKLPTSTCKAKNITAQMITTSTTTQKPTTTTKKTTMTTTTKITATSEDRTIPPILLLEPATYLTLQETNRLRNKNKTHSTIVPFTTSEKSKELAMPSKMSSATTEAAKPSPGGINETGLEELIATKKQDSLEFSSSVPTAGTNATSMYTPSPTIDTAADGNIVDGTDRQSQEDSDDPMIKSSTNVIDTTEMTNEATDVKTDSKEHISSGNVTDSVPTPNSDKSSILESQEKPSTPKMSDVQATKVKDNFPKNEPATESPNEQISNSAGISIARNVSTDPKFFLPDTPGNQQHVTKPPNYPSIQTGPSVGIKYVDETRDKEASIPINNRENITLPADSEIQTSSLANIIRGSYDSAANAGVSTAKDTYESYSSEPRLIQTTMKSQEIIHDLGRSEEGITLAPLNIPGQTTTVFNEVVNALGPSYPTQQEFAHVNIGGRTTTVSTEILQELAAYSLKPITEDQAEIMSNYILRDVPAQTYCDGKDADIYFVLDGSNSIWPEDFKVQLQFVNNVIDILDVTLGNTRVGVVVYSTQIHPIVMVDSGMTRSQIKRQVKAINYVSGRTNTSDALRFIRQYGFSKQRAREGAVKLAIVLTDGISRSPLVTKRESNLCREQGIHLFAVGIGKRVDKTELKRIANDPDQKFMFHVDSYQALNRIRDFLAITACSVAPDQPRTEPVCKDLDALDVLFSYDSYGLGSRKSQMINFFIHDVLNSLDFSNGNLQVGRVTDNCPEITDIPIGPQMNISDFASTDYPGISPLLRRMKTSFSNRDVKKLGVLFVDESTEKIKNAIRVLKDGIDYNLMVVGIGDERITEAAGDLCSYPKHDYFIQVPKYSNLLRARSKLLDKICTTMMAI